MTRITTTLDSGTLSCIDREAERMGISRSQLVAMAVEHYLQSLGGTVKQTASEMEQMEMQIRILQDHICWLEGEIKQAHHEKEMILQKIPPYPPGNW